MKQYLLSLSIIFFSLSLFAQKKQKGKMIRVYGTVTQTSDYCGGAAPSEEILKNLSTPSPLAEKEIYVRTGAKNKPSKSGQNPVYTKVTTDENGKFSVMLKSGSTYCFIEDWKAKPFKVPANTKHLVWDASCLYERYILADFVITVTKNNPEVKINYHKPCFYSPYCGTYSGPLPP